MPGPETHRAPLPGLSWAPAQPRFRPRLPLDPDSHRAEVTLPPPPRPGCGPPSDLQAQGPQVRRGDCPSHRRRPRRRIRSSQHRLRGLRERLTPETPHPLPRPAPALDSALQGPRTARAQPRLRDPRAQAQTPRGRAPPSDAPPLPDSGLSPPLAPPPSRACLSQAPPPTRDPPPLPPIH